MPTATSASRGPPLPRRSAASRNGYVSRRSERDTSTDRLPVSVSPRYDLPKAAPEPLRRVQLFLNSENHESGDDWLDTWLAENGVEREADARLLRPALRELVRGNNGFPVTAEAVGVVDDAAARLSVGLDDDARPVVRRGADALDEVVAIALTAMLDGSFGRLKACRNCHWAFYDYSPNRSAAWCSMQLCGNRRKVRDYRRRLRAK
jgi:predicted RNA-binding Zn ribbon-like protein